MINMFFLRSIEQQVKAILGDEFEVIHKIPERQKAWLAVPVFRLAKMRGVSLQDLANEIVKKLETIDGFEIEIVGGYVNLTPTNDYLVKVLAGEVSAKKSVQNSTVIIEFSSPNIAKPMSIGHLRSTIIGDSLQRIYKFLGYKVVSINYIGDWGTQFGKLLVAYQRKYGNLELRDISVKELLDLYVDFHKHASDKDEEEARKMFALLETGDKQAKTLWQHLKAVSIEEFDKLYDELGVTFTEKDQGEFEASKSSGEIIDYALQKSIAKESDGAVIIPFENIETPLILKKQDGSTIYGTRDLATLKYRLDTYKPNKILYVVGVEQSLHLGQVFEAARLFGFAKSVDLEHVQFGHIRLPEGKISTREGRVILLSDVINEAKSRARQIIEKKKIAIPEDEKNKLIDTLAIGALKYFDLKHSRQGDIIFNWDEMLSLKGKSAPYLQYSYVRARSIIDKVGKTDRVEQIDSHEDTSLLRLLCNFDFVVEESATYNSPHILANYLNELSEKFHWFYENYRVLVDDKNSKNYRLAVTALVANTIKSGLDLLGIDTVDRM